MSPSLPVQGGNPNHSIILPLYSSPLIHRAPGALPSLHLLSSTGTDPSPLGLFAGHCLVDPALHRRYTPVGEWAVPLRTRALVRGRLWDGLICHRGGVASDLRQRRAWYPVSPVERGGRLDTTVADEPAEPQSASPNTHLSATAAWDKRGEPFTKIGIN